MFSIYFQGHQSLSDSYLRFLGRTGLSVSVAQVRWYTTCFNRTFVRLGQWRPRFLHLWFTCGVYFGFVAMLFSVCILSLLVVNTIQQQPVEQQVLTPVVSREYHSQIECINKYSLSLVVKSGTINLLRWRGTETALRHWKIKENHNMKNKLAP